MIVVVAFVFLVATAANGQTSLLEGTFTTQLDHSRPQDPRTVEFRYFANFDHYEYGGPFYINIKDAGDSSTQWIEDSLMVDIAANTSAALFTFDSRFFGTNIPTESLSLEDLNLMEPEQALADLATFVTFLHQEYDTEYLNNDVTVFGSGFGGTMAVWARKKFPHLIDGAWSSSGLFQVSLNSFSLYDSIGFMFYWVEMSDCRNSVLNVFNELDALVEADNSARIQELLNLCHPIDTDDENDVGFLFQQHINYILRYIDRFHADAFTSLCEFLPQSGAEQSFLEVFGQWLDQRYGNECRDIKFDHFVERMSSTDLGSVAATSANRQRLYMQCSQTGLFQITDNFTWLPNRIQQSFHNATCAAVFGEQFDMNWLTLALNGVRNSLGSYSLSVTNTIFSNGELDAYSGNGIWFTNEPNSIAYNIAQYSKSADMPSVQPFDQEHLIIIKNEIRERIIGWAND